MKKISVLVAILCIGCMVFAGCGSGDDTVNGDSVETNTEVEASEEVVVEETVCTAQDIMTLVDTLTAKYTYDNPEHIKAMVIAANLDYIPEEELNTLLTTYGYTIDDLNQLLYEGTVSLVESVDSTFEYYKGMEDSVDDSLLFDNRISLSDIMLDEKDKAIAVQADMENINVAHYTTSNSDYCKIDATISGETMIVYVSDALWYYEYNMTPYDNYQNVK